MGNVKTVPCPTCKKTVEVGSENFPFCCDRCRLLDLGKWASEGYVISSPIHDPDVLDELEGLHDRMRPATGQGSGE